MQSPSRMAPQYQYASRNPITGAPTGVTSRPGTAGSRPASAGGLHSPRSASKLANLMNGSGTPGTPLGGARAASVAQLHQRPRPF